MSTLLALKLVYQLIADTSSTTESGRLLLPSRYQALG